MFQKIEITVKPDSEFEIPASDGYRLYSSLLNSIKEVDVLISKHVHDSLKSSIHLSGLKGNFFKSSRPNFKKVSPKEKYKFHIGVTDEHEMRVFQAFVRSLIFEHKNLNLEIGELIVENFVSSSITYDKIIELASKYKRPEIYFDFKSPVCIQYRNSDVTEMFPHRLAIFRSILSKWNGLFTNEFKLALLDDDIERYLIEKPDANSYKTHAVMVNTVFDENKGHPRPIFKQGFTGNCVYRLTKDAPVSVKNAVVILALFSEYSGVGSGVSRGCGWVEVNVKEVGK